MTTEQSLVGNWTLDSDHSRIGFSARHAMVSKIRGAFNDVTGTLVVSEDGWDASKVTVSVDVNSIDTRNADRDAHLRGADFFDVEQYPTMEFVSESIDEVDSNQYIVYGDLTIRGITKSVSIPLEITGMGEDSFGNLRAGLEGNRRIDRKEWGIVWNETLDAGGVMISDKISLEFELSLVKNK